MPRVKPPQQFGGLHLVLCEDLQKHIGRQGHDFSLPSNPALHRPHSAPMPGLRVPLTRDEILTLIRVAEKPTCLSAYRSCEHTVKAFGVLFAKWPDEVLDILQFIRAKLKHYNNTQAGRVTVFLRTRSCFKDDKGNIVAVAKMTDGEIAQHLTRPGLDISPDSVKMARQKIAREDKQVFFFTEHPQNQEFMRTGVMNPKLKRLLRSHAKGKK